MGKIKASNENFLAIYTRFPSDNQYAPLGLYNLYLNQINTNNESSEKTKTTILKKYPKSVYSTLLKNPDYSLEMLTKKDSLELEYKKVYALYEKKQFQQVIKATTNIKNSTHKDKLLFLRALSFIQTEKKDIAAEVLVQISNKESPVFEEASYVLDAIKNPSKIERANEIALAGSPYLYRPKKPHMIILILPKKDVDITYLKTVISDFHTTSIGNDIFEISALLLGLEKHILMVKSFETINESMEYYDLFFNEQKIMSLISSSEHKIMSISLENFPQFYKNKDIEGYYDFFTKNYLTTN